MNSYLFLLITILLGLNYLLIFSNANISTLSQNILFAFVCLTFNVILVSTILSILGSYNLFIMNAILAVQTILITVYCKIKKYKLNIVTILYKIADYKFNNGVVLVILICSILYMAFPTKYMLAGRDPGLYFLNGIHIAKTGNWQYETDSYLNENYSDIKSVVQLGYPGLFSAYDFDSISENPGDIIPQFMPMFPSILAVGYDIGGTEALIRVNGFISILSLLSIYYFTKSFFNTKAALLAIIFMALNPAQLWGARVTETEILSQLLFFVSMHVFAVGWKENNNKLTFISGILIGFGAINRMDSYIMGIGVYALLIYCSLFNRNKLMNSLICATAYTLSGALSFIYGITFSRPYFISHWRSGSLSSVVYINLVFLALSVGSIIIGKLLNKKIRKNYILEIINNKKALAGICISLLGLFLVTYFIRPLFNNEDIYNGFNSRAMVEFCWYTSFIAIPLAIYGLYNILHNSKDNGESIFLFLLIGISTMVIYIFKPSITPDHIYTRIILAIYYYIL